MSLIPPSPLLSTNKNNNNNTTSSCPGYNSSSMPGTALSTFYTTQTPQQEAGTSITYILVSIFALLLRSREVEKLAQDHIRRAGQVHLTPELCSSSSRLSPPPSVLSFSSAHQLHQFLGLPAWRF